MDHDLVKVLAVLSPRSDGWHCIMWPVNIHKTWKRGYMQGQVRRCWDAWWHRDEHPASMITTRKNFVCRTAD